MAAPRVEEVIDFLFARGFSAAADALRDDVLSRCPTSQAAELDLDVGIALPPLKLSTPSLGGGDTARASADSSPSDTFVSLGSSPFELLNPYGVWSPARSRSDEESTDRQSDFGTARAYNNYWYDDQIGEYCDMFFIQTDSGQLHSEDKFIMSAEEKDQFEKKEMFDFGEDGHRHKHDHVGCKGSVDMYDCPFPIRDCCSGSKIDENEKVAEMIRSSSFAVYGRYQILDDQTERLDECGENEVCFKRIREQPDTIILEHDRFHDRSRVEGKECSESDITEEKLQALDHNVVNDSTCGKYDPKIKNDSKGDSYNRNIFSVNKMDDGELQKECYSISPFEEEVYKQGAKSAHGDGDCRISNKELQEPEAVDLELKVRIHNFHLDHFCATYATSENKCAEFLCINFRTGFEESKEFPIVLKSVIAGRYYITEYLGSAAFSKVVQAHDLHTGMDVCLKIINNDKDFFDQSLDEIKLLKFVNRHDPSDEHHLLRLYDYFYYQEHLFIVTELLKANLYEFQKYNHESGGVEYYTLSRIQDIARQCLEALLYLHHLRIIHCDLKPENILLKSYSRCEIKIIDLGSSCFEMDNLCTYVQSRSYRAPEVILGLSYDQKIDIWSLGCILAELYTGDVLFPNDSVPMILARMIGILGPIDEEMLSLGLETNKYFTEKYDLYHTNEETDQVEYLIPESSSLSHQLLDSDAKFVDFLSCLLQINPRRRPTASEALEHEWLSISYH
ncbi:probable serine/threonine-protein kinase clkA isoform X1 [Zingiber officinale]|uniref:probable serine/threonine-protein kinase clkA isoform X1 n=1 Tax=Zingiber officinale TaxID=94328 RepID=UPI001C4CADA6|nr:probable serine/threonine-protein kinase clkA isoform X1 [Zingiber officinale]